MEQGKPEEDLAILCVLGSSQCPADAAAEVSGTIVVHKNNVNEEKNITKKEKKEVKTTGKSCLSCNESSNESKRIISTALAIYPNARASDCELSAQSI